MRTVTSIEQLSNIKLTDVEELPPFADGTPFIAELRKPNMMGLLASGRVPNPLMKVAMKLFVKGDGGQVMSQAEEDPKVLIDLLGLLDILAKECLVSPTYEEISSLGIELSDDQLMGVMMYVQGGAKSLEGFRRKFQSDNSPKPIPEV